MKLLLFETLAYLPQILYGNLWLHSLSDLFAYSRTLCQLENISLG
jgi:hypothetical protein